MVRSKQKENEKKGNYKWKRQGKESKGKERNIKARKGTYMKKHVINHNQVSHEYNNIEYLKSINENLMIFLLAYLYVYYVIFCLR